MISSGPANLMRAGVPETGEGTLRDHAMIAFLLMAQGIAGPGLADGPAPPVPELRPLGSAAWLISGGILADREPDGNTVVFDAPQGLVVVDTGRHTWHRQAILDLAAEHERTIVAVINSHWHLDHVSGNAALRAAFPQLSVYSSNAIDGALTGFLASSSREYANYVDDERFPETLRDDIRGDILAIENGAALRPDATIEASTTMNLGGRALQVNLARHAVTSGDVWLFDEQSGVAVLGDLVTLPVPFLDTACPEGWRAALAQVSASRFRIAVPGHGAPMTPEDVSRYRQAFDSFIDCAGSPRQTDECAAGWVDAVRTLLAADAQDVERAKAMAVDYVEMLRASGGRSKYCEAPPGPAPPD